MVDVSDTAKLETSMQYGVEIAGNAAIEGFMSILAIHDRHDLIDESLLALVNEEVQAIALEALRAVRESHNTRQGLDDSYRAYCKTFFEAGKRAAYRAIEATK